MKEAVPAPYLHSEIFGEDFDFSREREDIRSNIESLRTLL
jgi:hypothetical protein